MHTPLAWSILICGEGFHFPGAPLGKVHKSGHALFYALSCILKIIIKRYVLYGFSNFNSMTISKEQSTLFKGILILMMIFLHLFDNNHIGLCTNTIIVGNKPLALWLHNACGPVGFFLLLSGYGLAYTFYNGNMSFAKQGKRIFKLYVNYLVILLFFVFIGSFISTKYPGSLQEFVYNIIGWSYFYNAELWFFLPYCILSILSPIIIRGVDYLGNIRTLLLTGFIHICTCFIISRYGDQYLYNNMLLYRPLQPFHFLYSFTVGIVFYRIKEINWKFPSWVTISCIIIMVCVVAISDTAAIYMFYEPLLIFLLCQISFSKYLKNVLMELGRKSMPMWMIHTWFCYYLFQPQVYSLRYPIVIFIITVIISYLTAIPFMWIAQKCYAILIKMTFNSKE